MMIILVYNVYSGESGAKSDIQCDIFISTREVAPFARKSYSSPEVARTPHEGGGTGREDGRGASNWTEVGDDSTVQTDAPV